MTDDTLGIVLLGGGVVAVSALTRRSPRIERRPLAPDARWIYPVPSLGDRLAVISNPFRALGDANEHLGVDLLFKRRDARDLIAIYPPKTANGTSMFFMPDGIAALAASAGTVTLAASTPIGDAVIVNHSNGWATYYTHLASLAVKRGDTVASGQPLGTIGASPRDAAHLVHLHFELWKAGTREGAIDPAPYLAAWARVSSAWSPTRTTVALRNASLTSYRQVGDRGEPYPEWVRRLRGESGVYVIREIGGPIVYVGSSVGRLYETLTRHFQADIGAATRGSGVASSPKAPTPV